MKILKFQKRAIFFIGAACVIAAPVAYAQSMNSDVLNGLGKGQWQLRAVGSGPSRVAQNKICIGDPMKLVQIQHGSANCSQRILNERGNKVTVSYSCRGQGQGITTIRRESNRLIQINSQGIRNGSPFNFSVEGRLGGSC